jgi:hypothetical protein
MPCSSSGPWGSQWLSSHGRARWPPELPWQICGRVRNRARNNRYPSTSEGGAGASVVAACQRRPGGWKPRQHLPPRHAFRYGFRQFVKSVFRRFLLSGSRVPQPDVSRGHRHPILTLMLRPGIDRTLTSHIPVAAPIRRRIRGGPAGNGCACHLVPRGASLDGPGGAETRAGGGGGALRAASPWVAATSGPDRRPPPPTAPPALVADSDGARRPGAYGR